MIIANHVNSHALSNKKVLFKDLSKTAGIVNAYNAIMLAERKLNK